MLENRWMKGTPGTRDTARALRSRSLFPNAESDRKESKHLLAHLHALNCRTVHLSYFRPMHLLRRSRGTEDLGDDRSRYHPLFLLGLVPDLQVLVFPLLIYCPSGEQDSKQPNSKSNTQSDLCRASKASSASGGICGFPVALGLTNSCRR